MDNSVRSGGIGFFGILLIVFIVLKLVGIINWSWWLVFIPLWIYLGILILLCIVGGIIIAWLRR